MNGAQHPVEGLQKTAGFLIRAIVVKPVGVPENLERLFHEVRFQSEPHGGEEQPVMVLLIGPQESFPLQTGSDVISSLQEAPEFVLPTEKMQGFDAEIPDPDPVALLFCIGLDVGKGRIRACQIAGWGL